MVSNLFCSLLFEILKIWYFVVEKTYPRINASVGKIKLLLMATAVYKYFTITK